MKASIIIPTYNRGYVIAETLESMFGQTYRDFEVIVVDDCSTDDTARIVQKIGDARLRYVRHEVNKGPAGAFNTGVRASSGDLISFCGSDDLWDREMIECHVNFLQRHPEVHASFSDVSKTAGRDSVVSVVRTYPIFSRFLAAGPCVDGIALPQREMYLCLLQEMPVKSQAVLLRRQPFLNTGEFDESTRCGEDWDFLIRFARQHRFGYIDRPLTTQRIMRDSVLASHHTEDALFMIDCLAREKRLMKHDSKVRRCANRAIAQHFSRVAWWQLQQGKKALSAKSYLKGFLQTGSPALLARIPSAYFPRSLRSFVRRTLRSHAARQVGSEN